MGLSWQLMILSPLLLVSLSLSQIHAREAHLFSSVIYDTNSYRGPELNSVKETQLSNKDDILTKQEQYPSSITDAHNAGDFYDKRTRRMPPSYLARYEPYTTMANQDHESYFFHGGNGYKRVRQQGMSDTRFLENGRYFYDISKDQYDPVSDQYYENNSDELASRNEYAFRNKYHRTNHGNSMHEFEASQDDQFVP